MQTAKYLIRCQGPNCKLAESSSIAAQLGDGRQMILMMDLLTRRYLCSGAVYHAKPGSSGF